MLHHLNLKVQNKKSEACIYLKLVSSINGVKITVLFYTLDSQFKTYRYKYFITAILKY